MESVSKKEAKFILTYNGKISYLKGESPSGMLPYTKLSLPQAIIHYLIEINIVFHPLSLSHYPIGERAPEPTKEDFTKVLESIILHEEISEYHECHLTTEELNEAISCFRQLTRKQLQVGI